MKDIIPYTKDILFKTKIAEITSISLEKELDILDHEIKGNFIVSGEYKAHEISINKEEFLYKLPFSVEITDNIDKESLSFEITDFTYDVVDNEILRVNIEFEVSASQKLEEKEEEAPIVEFEKVDEEIDETKIEIPSDGMDRQNNPKETILNTIDENDEEYTTYNIHIVRENETLESICENYNVSIDLVKEYNDVDDIKLKDKLIIPIIDNE